MHATQWNEVEIDLTARVPRDNAYVTVSVWADFTHSDGTVLRRPAFWDGGTSFKIRFASPLASGDWKWVSYSDSEDPGLTGYTGTIVMSGPGPVTNRFFSHGFLRMSPQKRNLVHADGEPMLLAGDTAWALPFRATVEQCREYAQDRKKKGFNAALLMTVQPDMKAVGPRDRTADEGFDVGFEDLPEGHLNKLNPTYFQTLDTLTAILVEHEIVPVYQPVFHGYGWKGQQVAGRVIPDNEYARFCRYLVARYGARPAMYLPSGDGHGYFTNVRAGGREFHAWDCYGQPTGNHYSPHATNRAWQEEEWLDFQWCQTGHMGEHMPERVMDMWRNTPPKAIANGEPTYEEIGFPGNGAGWWQGHEALGNIFSGGTMGTVYGAGSLWNWVLKPHEPGHADWCTAQGRSWRDALAFPGSVHPGIIAKIFEQYPFADMVPNWDYTFGKRGLTVPGKFYAVYLSTGGHIGGIVDLVPRNYRVYNPKNGQVCAEGTRDSSGTLAIEQGEPRLVIFYTPETAAG